MNKLIIPIIFIVIIIAGTGAYFIFQKPAFSEMNGAIPYYFIAIHNEPHNSEPEGRKKIEKSYAILKKMVKKADEYNIKLTLMFTAQWADYISESPERTTEFEEWKKQGHEIAAHHHSIYHGNWDGYTDYAKEEAENQRIKQGKTPEEYLGTLDDFIKKLKKINPNIHSGCMNAEDKKEMPDEIYYDTCSGFANHGEPGKRERDSDTSKKGKNEYITVGVYKNIARKWLAHYQTTLDRRQQKAQEVFNSMNSGVYGSVNHSAIHEESAFYSWLEFLHSKDPTGEKSRTVSEIIDQKLIPEKLIPEELVNKRFLPLPQNKCGDNICDEIERANPNLCPRDCEKKPEET